jgi:predicted dehydrogenase
MTRRNIARAYLLNKMGHPLAARIENGLDRFGIWSNKKAELEYFLKAVQSCETPKPSGEDGLSALRICVAALESANTHQPVSF